MAPQSLAIPHFLLVALGKTISWNSGLQGLAPQLCSCPCSVLTPQMLIPKVGFFLCNILLLKGSQWDSWEEVGPGWGAGGGAGREEDRHLDSEFWIERKVSKQRGGALVIKLLYMPDRHRHSETCYGPRVGDRKGLRFNDSSFVQKLDCGLSN